MKAQTSWVSVTNSKLGPSTMASTGHASWQNPLQGRSLSEQSLQEASGITPISHYGSPHCLHHLLQLARAHRHKAEGNLPVNALSHVNVIPANHNASFNEQQSRINEVLDPIIHHHHHHLDEYQHEYWRSQAVSQNNFI